MIDPMTSRLAQVQHLERLEAAAAARQRRATWIVAPSLIALAREAIAKRLIKLGQRMQAPTKAAKAYR